MSSLGNAPFDPNAKENKGGFDPIPAGDYPMVAVKSIMKSNGNNDGKYLNVEFQVLSGPFQNRRIFKRFNWETTRTDDGAKKAVTIGRGQFSKLCRAVNVSSPSNSEELHNIPFIGKVSIRPERSGYDEENEIGSFKPIDPTTPPTATHAQPPVNAGASAAGKPSGW